MTAPAGSEAAKRRGAARSSAPDRVTATLSLDEPVGRVKLVSPGRAAALEKLGITTVRDLVNHYPRRYLDLSQVCTIAEAPIGSSCTLSATVHAAKLKRPRPRLSLTEITLVDGTGTLIVAMFRQPWLAEKLRPGMIVAVAGKVTFDYGFKRMINPFLDVLSEAEGAGGGAAPRKVEGSIVPVHGATEKVPVAIMRNMVGNALEMTQGMLDPLPLDVRCRYRLMSRGMALQCIQFPKTMDEVHQARRRLAYEELLFLELFMMQQARARTKGMLAAVHTVDGPHLRALAEALPFTLTDEQQRARDELLAVMGSPFAASHMLFGDVGTGKTVVAAHALAAAADSGGQALLMAPTEVLARQHEKSLSPLLDAAGVTHGVLTGSTAAAEREDLLERLASGELQVLIGTHALLEDAVRPARMTLAVIDEQQRFGVDQRERLLRKGEPAGLVADALFLTATPIPRSMALALFGSFTLSYLRHGPHDAANRTTKVLAKKDVGLAYDAARAQLEAGHQVYVVCPLIGKSAEERDGLAVGGGRQGDDEEELAFPCVAIESDDDLADDDITAATKEAAFLQAKVFADYEVGLLHGGMDAASKQDVMERFSRGEIDVLVATTVIEVGVDVPNATVMVIQDADRFGLAQLHQLRGRVGRGEAPGEVFLVSASQTEAALARLAAMERTDDGYELAAYDLSLRREGDIMGNRQSGAGVLRLVNVVRDGALIECAHADARAIMEADPELALPDHVALAREMRLLFKNDRVGAGG